MKPRNHTIALIAKNDPSRYRSRVVETKKRKLRVSRARRREKERGEKDIG